MVLWKKHRKKNSPLREKHSVEPTSDDLVTGSGGFSSTSGFEAAPSFEKSFNHETRKLTAVLDAAMMRGQGNSVAPILMTGAPGTGKGLMLSKAFALARGVGMRTAYFDAAAADQDGRNDPIRALANPLAQRMGVPILRHTSLAESEDLFDVVAARLLTDPQANAPTGLLVAIRNLDLLTDEGIRKVVQWVAHLQSGERSPALPIVVIVTGPVYCADLISEYPTQDRVWTRITLGAWEITDAADVFVNTCRKGEIELEPDALRILAHESAGNAWRVQRLGEYAWQHAEDGVITASSARRAATEFRYECEGDTNQKLDELKSKELELLEFIGSHLGVPVPKRELAHYVAQQVSSTATEAISSGHVKIRIRALVSKRLIDRDPSRAGFVLVAPGLDDKMYHADLNPTPS